MHGLGLVSPCSVEGFEQREAGGQADAEEDARARGQPELLLERPQGVLDRSEP
jgi:hypothetical protein